MQTTVILALIAGVVLGALAASLALAGVLGRARVRASELAGAVAALRSDNELLRAEQGRARALDDMLQPVRESLESLRRASDSASRDRTQAEPTLATQIAAVQERYQSLEVATKQLASALARGQTRGQWGEMQLEGLLAHAGLLEGTHYRRQESRSGSDGGTRPDIVVTMPGGGEILVDAKFPFDAYWTGIGTDDPVERDAHLRKHAADVLSRAKELSAKRYSDAALSPDFVVMFLPLESLLSAALEADGLLLERTFERRVVLATPTTMLALLRTVSFGYQRALMADNAEEIKRAGAEMLSRLGILAGHLDALRRGLDQAVRGYNTFVGSFDSQAMRQARRLNDLGIAAQRGLETPEVIDVALRESDPVALRE
ncbi:MAG: DNA recombination protein RmuC [Actinobacteria bacterium]|nr:DNA recombination protein RmuC [Actinomycetota bacterium]